MKAIQLLYLKIFFVTLISLKKLTSKKEFYIFQLTIKKYQQLFEETCLQNNIKNLNKSEIGQEIYGLCQVHKVIADACVPFGPTLFATGILATNL